MGIDRRVLSGGPAAKDVLSSKHILCRHHLLALNNRANPVTAAFLTKLHVAVQDFTKIGGSVDLSNIRNNRK